MKLILVRILEGIFCMELGWVANSLNQMLSTSLLLSDRSIVRFPSEGMEDNQLGTEDYDGPSQNSVLDVLPKTFMPTVSE